METQNSLVAIGYNLLSRLKNPAGYEISGLAVTGNGGFIYASTDGGVTWTQTSAPSAGWQAIASSADGTHLAAAIFFGSIYASTNSGLTWTQTSAPSSAWQAIASSADGTRLAAAATYSGGIYTSTNSGLTWTQSSAPSTHWSSIASSADGTRLAAVEDQGGGIYISTNGGLTWSQSTAPFIGWKSIASSADGTRLVAASYGGIYTSTGVQSSLTSGTIYHYRLVSLNSAGATFGTDMTFTTPVGAPTAITLAASGVTTTNATLNADVNTGGLDTAEFFEYGLDTDYGSFTALNSLAATNTTLLLSTLASLAAGTTYHFQVVGFNSEGTSLGGDMTFTTLPLAPVVTTLMASSISASNATLNGTVNPGNGVTTAFYQFGLDTNYGDIGGFTVLSATSATLTFSGFVISVLTGTAGTQWTQSNAPSEYWNSIASSADGTRLAAVVYGGGIYTSTDGGVAWTQSSAPSTYWYSIASSADGTRLAAIDGSTGYIWTSTNSGGTWMQSSAPSTYWYSIASSADGTRLAAIDGIPGHIWTSTDGGVSWSQSSAPYSDWYSIASSADGTRLAVGGIYIWTSTNSGVTWTQSSAPSDSWLAIAPSADGTRLAAVDGTYIWTSCNSGVTWTQCSAPSVNWQAIASSADGTHLAAVDGNPGYIWTSTNSGATWTQTSAPLTTWNSIASSADGTRLAAVDGSYIWTSTGVQSVLTPNTTYHYRLVGLNSGGTTLGADLTFTTAALTANPFTLSGSAPLAVDRNGTFQLRFTNLSGLSFTVLTTTNLRSAMSNWTVLGAPVETPPGQYQFNDPQSTNRPQSFYRVRSP